MKTQISSIVDFMLTHAGITSLQAIQKFGATRLSGIIYTLKKQGYNIEDKWITVETRFGKARVKRYYILGVYRQA